MKSVFGILALVMVLLVAGCAKQAQVPTSSAQNAVVGKTTTVAVNIDNEVSSLDKQLADVDKAQNDLNTSSLDIATQDLAGIQ